VDIISAAYLGKDYRQVQATLETMGLSVRVIPQQSTATAGTVLQVNPTGTVPKGSEVTVTYAVAPPAATTAAPVPTATTPAVSAPTPNSSLAACTPGELPGTPPTCKP
jgi:serine/threonine-protein kinase